MSSPFDLHVLSTPPAFVLSQDQTLYKMVSKRTVVRSNLHRAICHSFIFIVTSSAKLTTAYLRQLSGALPWFLTVELTVWCFLFVTLFNLQGTRRFRPVFLTVAQTRSFVNWFFQNLSIFNQFCKSLVRNSLLRIPNQTSKVNTFSCGLCIFFNVHLFSPICRGLSNIMTNMYSIRNKLYLS